MNLKLKRKKFNLRQQKRIVKRALQQKENKKLMKSFGGRYTFGWFIRCIKLEKDLKGRRMKSKKLLKKYQVTNALLEQLNGKTNSTGETT